MDEVLEGLLQVAGLASLCLILLKSIISAIQITPGNIVNLIKFMYGVGMKLIGS